MLSRILRSLFIMVLCLYPLAGLGEGNYLELPDAGAKAYFFKEQDWTFVTPETVETHMDLLTQRGDAPPEIRERFSSSTLLFEAYHPDMEKDACIRYEVIENSLTQEIWHLQHLSGSERKQFLKDLQDLWSWGNFTFLSPSFRGQGKIDQWIECGFTTNPPLRYESGRMAFRFLNGKMHIISYCVRGRRASDWRYLSPGEKKFVNAKTPFHEVQYAVELLPKQVEIAINEYIPGTAGTGSAGLSGTITKGASLKAVLNGEPLPIKIKSTGSFSLDVPMPSEGEYTVTLTTSKKGMMENQQFISLVANASTTPLILTEYPEEMATAGDITVSGITSPNASLTMYLDAAQEVTVPVDGNGRFSYTFSAADVQVHYLTVTAQENGLDAQTAELFFLTDFGTVEEGIAAFAKDVVSLNIEEVEKNPENFAGNKVALDVHVTDVFFIKDGLAIRGYHTLYKGKEAIREIPLYITLYGYGQDTLTAGMDITVYGIVSGQETFIDTQQQGKVLLLPSIALEYAAF